MAIAASRAGIIRRLAHLVGDEFEGAGTDIEVKVTSDGELVVTPSEHEINVTAALQKLGVTTASAYAVMVDLSDTTNFHHLYSGKLHVSLAHIQVERDATATGKVLLGVITRVDGTNADISYFASLLFDKSTERHVEKVLDFMPSQVKLDVVAGVPTKLVTNIKETNVAAVNTATALLSPRGAATVTPAVGDLVAKLEWTAGTYDAEIVVGYHGKA